MWGRRNVCRRHLLALGAGAIGLRSGTATQAATDERWGIDYGASTDPELARACRLLVLEPYHTRPIAPLRGPGSTVLGYVSLGEVERSRPGFASLAEAGALRQANPNWPDARYADFRHPSWRAAVLGRSCRRFWRSATTASSSTRWTMPRRWSGRTRPAMPA